jgi:oxygen-dependent protoporphyrinogen oxidase
VEAEAKYGSLALAMRALRDAQKKQAAGGERETSAFTSLKRGVGDLVVNVAHRLRDAEVTTGDPAAEVARLPDGDVRGRWGVRTAKGETIFADDVALTVPAYAAAKVLATVDPALVSMLGDVAYASTATVFLAYRKFDVRHPLDAVGFLVPKSEGRPILACTFVSSKWDHRAPAGQVLLRVVVGGASQDHVLQRTDEELVQMAREQLRDLLGIDRSPMFTKVFRWAKASAQPTVGHLARMRAVLDRVGTHPGLHVGGGGYVGTGIADAVKQGEEIAERIEALRRSRATIT